MAITFLDIFIAFIITTLIYVWIMETKIYYSKESKEERKRMNNAVFDPKIHKECPECFGTCQDPSWGSCMECDGKGFIERNAN